MKRTYRYLYSKLHDECLKECGAETVRFNRPSHVDIVAEESQDRTMLNESLCRTGYVFAEEVQSEKCRLSVLSKELYFNSIRPQSLMIQKTRVYLPAGINVTSILTHVVTSGGGKLRLFLFDKNDSILISSPIMDDLDKGELRYDLSSPFKTTYGGSYWIGVGCLDVNAQLVTSGSYAKGFLNSLRLSAMDVLMNPLPTPPSTGDTVPIWYSAIEIE